MKESDRLQQLACLDSLAFSLRPFLKKLGEQLSFDEVEEQVLSFLENYYLNKNGQASLKTEKSFSLNDADSINDSVGVVAAQAIAAFRGKSC